MKPANQRVKQQLENLGIEVQITILDAAVRTAALAAAALGCEVGQIANSLIFRNRGDDRAILVMCAGDRRVDPGKVARLAGYDLIRADADFVRAQTGFAIGGVPPVGHAQALPTLLEVSLRNRGEIWAAAGTPESVFRMTPEQLARMTGGEWLDIAQD